MWNPPYNATRIAILINRWWSPGRWRNQPKGPDPTVEPAGAEPKALQNVCESLKAFLLALGDDVQMKELEQYVAFRRLKNFACIKRHRRDLQVWTGLDPSSVPLEEGFTRDLSQLGHTGTGDLEIRIQTAADLERAQPLLLRDTMGRDSVGRP